MDWVMWWYFVDNDPLVDDLAIVNGTISHNRTLCTI